MIELDMYAKSMWKMEERMCADEDLIGRYIPQTGGNLLRISYYSNHESLFASNDLADEGRCKNAFVSASYINQSVYVATVEAATNFQQSRLIKCLTLVIQTTHVYFLTCHETLVTVGDCVQEPSKHL